MTGGLHGLITSLNKKTRELRVPLGDAPKALSTVVTTRCKACWPPLPMAKLAGTWFIPNPVVGRFGQRAQVVAAIVAPCPRTKTFRFQHPPARAFPKGTFLPSTRGYRHPFAHSCTAGVQYCVVQFGPFKAFAELDVVILRPSYSRRSSVHSCTSMYSCANADIAVQTANVQRSAAQRGPLHLGGALSLEEPLMFIRPCKHHHISHVQFEPPTLWFIATCFIVMPDHVVRSWSTATLLSDCCARPRGARAQAHESRSQRGMRRLKREESYDASYTSTASDRSLKPAKQLQLQMSTGAAPAFDDTVHNKAVKGDRMEDLAT